ncbi:MAG: TolC family protein, partial [Bacteroidia bacterium]
MKNKFLLLTLLLTGFIYAQETPAQQYSFSLDQAIAHALEHNYSVINASRDIQIAEQKRWETTATGLPQINGGVDYTNNIEQRLFVVPASFGDPNAPDDAFIAVPFSPKHDLNARATLSQLLFDGSYLVALQASKTYLEYYRNYKQKTDNEIREEVIRAYGNVLLADESIRILELNKTNLDKTLFDTQETFKSGLIEEENVEQLQITLSTVNSNLNNSKRVREISYNMLKLSLGMTAEDNLTLTDKLENLTQKNLDLAISQSDFNVKGNLDYRIGQNFTEQRRLELMREKSRALPSLSANLNYGVNTFGPEFRDFFEVDQPWYDFLTFGVNLNVPIFSSFGRHARTQQAKIALEQAKTQLTETEQRLKLAYQNARSQYEFSV